MKLYVDATNGTWGELTSLRVVDSDSPKVLDFFEGYTPESNMMSQVEEYLDEASDSEIIWFASNYGKHMSSLIATAYRDGYLAGINSIAEGE